MTKNTIGVKILDEKANEQSITSVDQGFSFTFTVDPNANSTTAPTCVYWDAQNSEWSTSGCELVSFEN